MPSHLASLSGTLIVPRLLLLRKQVYIIVKPVKTFKYNQGLNFGGTKIV
jgi:hypothetical protein